MAAAPGPENLEGRKASASSLHDATVALFERSGFGRRRRLGLHHRVVTREMR